MEGLSSWFVSNYLQPNKDKTLEVMVLGNSSYRYDLEFFKDHLKILGICLDNKVYFKEHYSKQEAQIKLSKLLQSRARSSGKHTPCD